MIKFIWFHMIKSSNALPMDFFWGGLFTLLPENSPQEACPNVQPPQAMAPVARCVLQELLFEFLVLRPDTLNRWQCFLSAPGPRSFGHHWHLDSNTWYWQRKKQDQPTWAHRKKKWSSGSQFPPERAMECRGAPVSIVCDVGILHYHWPPGQQPFSLGHTWFPCNKSSTTDFPSGHKAVTRGKLTSGNRRW